MTTRRLLAWDRLGRKRRGLLPWILLMPFLGLLVGVGLYALARAQGSGEAHAWWRFGVAAAAAIVVMRGPWRLYWRPDGALLGRLPIPGRALYLLSAWNALRAGFIALVAALLAEVPVRISGGLEPFGHDAALAAAALAAAALASPALTAFAGAVIVSPAARRALREVAAGQEGPPSVWLSVLPGFGGSGVAWIAWTGAPMTAAIAAGVALAASLVALLFTAGLLGEATRAIAALDVQRLAHVDLVHARAGERVVGRLLAGRGRPVFEKDVALARRRHPAFYLITGLLLLALWLLAAFAPARGGTELALAAAIGAYAVLHARRLAGPPIEHPRFLRSLGLPTGSALRAKRIHAVWRVVWPLVAGLTPAVIRSPHPIVLALSGLAVAVVSAVMAAEVMRVRLRDSFVR